MVSGTSVKILGKVRRWRVLGDMHAIKWTSERFENVVVIRAIQKRMLGGLVTKSLSDTRNRTRLGVKFIPNKDRLTDY